MKKNFKRLFVLLLAVALVFPFVKAFALDEGDSTIFMRVPEGHGCFYISGDGNEDTYCSTKRYHVPGGTTVTLRANPEDGYHLVGWYEFSEVGDAEGGMTYPLDDEPLSIDNEYTFETSENSYHNIAPVFAEGREIPEIRITGELELETLEEGELPEFAVSTTTEHITISDYGDNTGWSKMPNGATNWQGFGTETPTAVADRTFYAMRLAVNAENGYVIKPNVTVIYNGRDMWDTYSMVTPYEWGGYVYVDFGQVAAPPGPSVEGNKILRVDFDVDLPQVGDIITVANDEAGTTQTQYPIRIPEEDLELYGPDGDETHNYMYIVDPETGELIEGELEANRRYAMVFWITAFEGYIFDEHVESNVNGQYIDPKNIHAETESRLGIQYEFEPDPADVTYTVSTDDGNFVVQFDFPEGTDFELSVIDILKYTPEEIEAMFDIPAEYIDEAVEQIKQNVKEYGDLISVYAIEINGPGFNFTGNGEDSITLRIKLTEEMEEYNTFKFLFLDENNNFVIQEVHTTNIVTDENGDKFIEVTLDHLSAYALVGSVEQSGNPTTGDHIVFYVSMLSLLTLGLVGVAIYTKKKYFYKTKKQD